MPYIDFVNTGTQITLAIVGLLYTYETRKLRKHSESQLGLLAQQSRMAIAPFLVPGVQDSGTESVLEKVRSADSLDDKEKAEFEKGLQSGNLKFVASAYNPTSKVASNVQLFIFDPTTKSFLECDSGKAWLEEKGHEIFTVSAPYYTHDEIQAKIAKHFGDNGRHLSHRICVSDTGYVALMYQDMEQRVYLVMRSFTVKKGGISHKTPAIYY